MPKALRPARIGTIKLQNLIKCEQTQNSTLIEAPRWISNLCRRVQQTLRHRCSKLCDSSRRIRVKGPRHTLRSRPFLQGNPTQMWIEESVEERLASFPGAGDQLKF